MKKRQSRLVKKTQQTEFIEVFVSNQNILVKAHTPHGGEFLEKLKNRLKNCGIQVSPQFESLCG